MFIIPEHRISEPNITKLLSDEIFVFGANLGQRPGKGAAKTATQWGARWGKCLGRVGRTYGIPTKDARKEIDPYFRKVLPVNEIRKYVDAFIEHAKTERDFTFLVTEIGCGYSNYTPEDMAPLFMKAVEVENIHLPKRFWDVIAKKLNEWK